MRDEFQDSDEFLYPQSADRRMLQIRSIGDPKKGATDVGAKFYTLPHSQMLNGLHGQRIPVAFLVLKDNVGLRVNFGNWSLFPESGNSLHNVESQYEVLKASLASIIPGVEIESTDADLLDEFSESVLRGGVVLGVPGQAKIDQTTGEMPLDHLVRAMYMPSWAMLVLAAPLEDIHVAHLQMTLLHEMQTLESDLQGSDKIAKPIGDDYRRTLRTHWNTLAEAHAYGGWRVCVYLIGTPETYHQLAGVWKGLYSGSKTYSEPIRIFESPKVAELTAFWAMPEGKYEWEEQEQFGYPEDIVFEHPFRWQTILSSKQLAAYVHVPRIETSGYSVRSLPSFDSVRSQSNGKSVSIGDIAQLGRNTGHKYHARLDSMTKHVFVTGITGSGKSTTVRHLLSQLSDFKVPFLVIEPAKREYRELLQDSRFSSDLHVYTPGNELVAPIRINPFERIGNTPINVHLDLLRSVFGVSLGMWTPLPQILEQCLYQIYEDRGWNVTHDDNNRLHEQKNDRDAFPTMSDLQEKVEEVVPSLGYDDRVRENVLGALRTRLNALRSGGKGRMYDTRETMPFHTLLRQPTVLELDGMGDDDDKAFFIGLLLILLYEYRQNEQYTKHNDRFMKSSYRQRQKVNSKRNDLKHLLIIEEAHRLLARPAGSHGEEQADPKGKAVETFTHILSEVRSYGQSIVIADQVPTKLAPDVIKNTNLKLVHRIVAKDDRDVLAGAMVMTEQQSLAMSTLRPTKGEVIVFGEEDDAPLRVNVPPPPSKLETAPLVSDEFVFQLMSQKRGDEYIIKFPLSGCHGICDDYGLNCEIAKDIVGTQSFQRLFTRLALSAIEDASAFGFDLGIKEIWDHIQSRVSASSDVSAVLRCVIVRACTTYSERLGARSGWTFEETRRFQRTLSDLILSEADRNTVSPHEVQRTYQLEALRLHERHHDPYPKCAEVCRQTFEVDDKKVSVCLYRHAAARLLEDTSIRRELVNVLSFESQRDGSVRPESWNICHDSASRVINLPDSPSFSLTTEELSSRARRVGLCIGQQIIYEDVDMPSTRLSSEMDHLIRQSDVSQKQPANKGDLK